MGLPPKNIGSSGGSLLPTGETPSTGGHPYSSVDDPELLNSVSLVRSGEYLFRILLGDDDRMKHTVALGAVFFSLFLWSCGGDDTPTAPTPRPTPVATSITLSVTSLSLASLGATSQISATVKDQNGGTMSGATVTWATSDAAVATASSSGLVTSIADGTATITATSGSATEAVIEGYFDNMVTSDNACSPS